MNTCGKSVPPHEPRSELFGMEERIHEIGSEARHYDRAEDEVKHAYLTLAQPRGRNLPSAP
jgi:hypothetical protein